MNDIEDNLWRAEFEKEEYQYKVKLESMWALEIGFKDGFKAAQKLDRDRIERLEVAQKLDRDRIERLEAALDVARYVARQNEGANNDCN
jgi:hypothetical protein